MPTINKYFVLILCLGLLTIFLYEGCLGQKQKTQFTHHIPSWELVSIIDSTGNLTKQKGDISISFKEKKYQLSLTTNGCEGNFIRFPTGEIRFTTPICNTNALTKTDKKILSILETIKAE